jgi:hypothetical protein
MASTSIFPAFSSGRGIVSENTILDQAVQIFAPVITTIGKEGSSIGEG